MPKTLTHQQMATNRVALPQTWPSWPILAMVRETDDDFDVGFMYDLFHHVDIAGYSATVFVHNALDVPTHLGAILALPKEIYDTPEEIVTAGWRPDM